MIPILFAGTDTAFWDSGGIGGGESYTTYKPFIMALVDAISCTVREERNGVFELELKYPVNAEGFNRIKVGRIVFAQHDTTHVGEPFDIYAYEVGTDGIATFRARHISYRLNSVIMLPKTATNINIQLYFASCCNGEDDDAFNTGKAVQDFQLRVLPNFSLIGDLNIDRPISLRDWLMNGENSLQAVYDAEFKWEGLFVYMYHGTESRGTHKAAIIRYGHNAEQMDYEFDSGDTVEYVIPYWTNSATGAVKRMIYNDGLRNCVAVNATGAAAADEPFIGMAVELLTDRKTAPSDEDLFYAGRQYFINNGLGNPYERLTIDYQDIGTGSGLTDGIPDDLNLCDTVTVTFSEQRIVKTMKVVETVYDTLNDRYISLTLGNLSRTLFGTDVKIGTPQPEEEPGIVVPVDMDIEVDPATDDGSGEEIIIPEDVEDE